MASSAMYREFARQCLEVAEALAPEKRARMFEMARHWHELAQQREHEERGLNNSARRTDLVSNFPHLVNSVDRTKRPGSDAAA